MRVGDFLGRMPTPSSAMTSSADVASVLPDRRYVGIEIEMEGYLGGAGNLLNWRAVNDGSLRNNGVEFVSNILGPKDVIPALDEIRPYLNRCEANWRAGIHVHVNVTDLTLDQVLSVAKMYALLEPLLFAWEGTGRDKNNFCPPWSVMPAHAEALVTCVNELNKVINEEYGSSKLITARRIVSRHLSNLHKYTSLNLAPLISFGTVEFRMMQSTKDIGRILEFVKLCANLVESGASMAEDNPLMLLSSLGPDGLLHSTGLVALNRVPNYEDLLWKGVSIANILETVQVAGDVVVGDDSFDDGTILIGEV